MSSEDNIRKTLHNLNLNIDIDTMSDVIIFLNTHIG